jgi:hypothetical protein
LKVTSLQPTLSAMTPKGGEKGHFYYDDPGVVTCHWLT